MNVVALAVPFQFATELASKLVPKTSTTVSAERTWSTLGLTVVTVGSGEVMVNVATFDVPPPGAALTTVTEGVPAVVSNGAEAVNVSSVALTKVVATGKPFQFTTDPATKFVPVTVTATSAEPARAVLGLIVDIVGNGLLIVNVALDEVPPPGAGFVTETVAVPALSKTEACTLIVSVVVFTKVVVTALPFQFTTELETYPVPVTVIVNAESPTVAELGEIEVIVGAGLLIVNVNGDDVPPPGEGLNTVTDAVPAVARFAAGMTAVIEVVETTVVANAIPFHRTTAVELKFEPVTVTTVSGLPATALSGLIDVRNGGGLLIAKGIELEVPPPGVGLNTVTRAVP